MREIAYVRVPHFAAAIERRDRLMPPDLPLILVGEARGGHQRVYACSSGAAEAGVEPDMRLRQAEALCPEAQILPSNESGYAAAFEEWIQRLCAITPDVEPDGLGQAYVDVKGLTPLFGEPQSVCRRLGQETWKVTQQWPAIGLAGSKFVARTAALKALPGHAFIVEKGTAQSFLGDLPVAYLPVSEEMQRRLGLLGLRTIGQYAALSRDAVTNQFGREGTWAHRLARGRDDRPLVPRHAQDYESVERIFDHPIEDLGTLRAISLEMVEAPLARLRSRLQGCQTIRVTLHFDNEDEAQRCQILREPAAGSSRMEYILNQLLEGFAYPCGVTGVAIALEDIRGEDGHQLNLFAIQQGQWDKLGRSIDKLAGKYTTSRFYTARLADERSLLPERRFVLEPFGPGS
jgi:DNA polymerase-4